MLAAINHVAGDNFILQQDSALAHHVCNRVQLLQHTQVSISYLQAMVPNITELTLLIIKYRHSYTRAPI